MPASLRHGRAALVAALAAALFAGCGGDEGHSGPETFAEFCRQAAASEVARRVGCIQLASEAAGLITARLEQSCLAEGASVAAGRMRYDQGAANACLVKMAQRSCSTGGVARLNCDSSPVVGTVAAGGNCLRAQECADATRCLQPGGPVCAFGTCEALVALDASCSAGQKCVAGAYCYSGTNTCQPLVAVSGDCSNGRYCVAEATCVNGVCEGPIPVNGACTPNQRCAAGAECHLGTCQIPVPPGGACGDTTLCSTGRCLDGKCITLAGPGQACDWLARVGCQDGSYCNAANTSEGTCVPQKTSGICTRELECAAGYTCDSGHCAPEDALLEIGETCVVGRRECVEGAWCSGGQCVLGPKLTEACGSLSGETRACLEGYCSTDASPVCTAFAKVDEPCASARCLPDLVCDSGTDKCVKCP